MAKLISKRRSLSAIPAKTFFAADSERGDATVRVGETDVQLTNLDKIYWPDEKYTKFDLLKYYYTVSKTILPYLKDRPLVLKRYPNGIDGMMFYQHNIENTPDFVEIYERTDSDGKTVHHALANNLATLLYLANLG